MAQTSPLRARARAIEARWVAGSAVGRLEPAGDLHVLRHKASTDLASLKADVGRSSDMLSDSELIRLNGLKKPEPTLERSGRDMLVDS